MSGHEEHLPLQRCAAQFGTTVATNSWVSSPKQVENTICEECTRQDLYRDNSAELLTALPDSADDADKQAVWPALTMGPRVVPPSTSQRWKISSSQTSRKSGPSRDTPLALMQAMGPPLEKVPFKTS